MLREKTRIFSSLCEKNEVSTGKMIHNLLFFQMEDQTLGIDFCEFGQVRKKAAVAEKSGSVLWFSVKKISDGFDV